MGLQIYNSLSRKKEPFKPLQPGHVGMYVCGLTVYAKAHVGHAMSSLVFDVVRRYLEHRGYQVTHVMNYTDVDDKVIKRAQELGVDPLELAEGYIREFDEQLKTMKVVPASVYPRVSKEIDHIVQMVEGLIEKGYAYQVDGDVFFRVGRDPDYGKLSGRRPEEMRAGARMDVDERKEDPADFALWKSAKPGEPWWESPWGRGRPGWHIECSAMAIHYLGEQIDIHGGGVDLIFPHHENEIAQTESLTGRPFARYWMHNGMLQFTGDKMSKSLGNVVTVETFLAENEPDVLRMLVLNSHYRSPLVFNDEVVEQAANALKRMKSALRPASASASDGAAVDTAARSLADQVEKTSADFVAAMDDDFNTPMALAGLFELVRSINQARDAGVEPPALAGAQGVLRRLAGVLGLELSLERADQPAAPFIDLLVEVRQQLRQARHFELADTIRDRLSEQGIILEDHQNGTIWRADG